jgi:hypothetical protein
MSNDITTNCLYDYRIFLTILAPSFANLNDILFYNGLLLANLLTILLLEDRTKFCQ